MICPARRWIFVHIQKTGGESVRTALGVELNDPYKHRTAVELRAIYGDAAWRDYYKFAFVRNPWDRLVSWWSMIDGLRPRFEAGEVLNAFQSYVLNRAKTFEEFLVNCGDEIADADGRKHIFRNQIDYLSDESGELIVDFIGRFERPQDDMDPVTSRIGIDRVALPRVNRSEHKSYREYHTQEAAALVADRYRRDLSIFGYRFAMSQAQSGLSPREALDIDRSIASRSARQPCEQGNERAHSGSLRLHFGRSFS
jgi:chondroitin 4-sulfotransferase 11